MGKKMILITGGCRSGKSRFALDYANQHYSKKLYLATCEVLDEEMAQRVENHKRMRGPEWQTIEEPIEIVDKIRQYGNEGDVILLDCITLWLSNLLIKGDTDLKIIDEINRFVEMIQQTPTSLIMVSNEVGMGIVPGDPLSRRFRDLSGMANQKIAEVVNTVIFMVSGIPIFLKEKSEKFSSSFFFSYHSACWPNSTLGREGISPFDGFFPLSGPGDRPSFGPRLLSPLISLFQIPRPMVNHRTPCALDEGSPSGRVCRYHGWFGFWWTKGKNS